MSNPIKTSNANGDSRSTRKQASESTAEWVDRHWHNVASEWEAGLFPLTDTLTTEWKVSNGTTYTHSTTRFPGESDADFFDRHATDTTTAMGSAPPAP